MGGTIVKVLVKENQHVIKGETLGHHGNHEDGMIR